MEKSCRKCARKVSPRPLFNFGKKKQDCNYMHKSLLKKRCFERGLSKNLYKVDFIFSFEPSPF